MPKKSKTQKMLEHDDTPTHIVGIGASAGGLEAIEQFVKNIDALSGIAYVIVQHLSPDYKSLMAELLAKYTDIPINRIEDGMEVKKNNIYLISPRKNIKLFHGHLISVDQEERNKGRLNLPIDIFFQSLAEDQQDKAIGIVLSGTGSDGTRGIKAIKENGGMTIAQLPESAKFDSMPESAISTGLVDFVLAPEMMPQQILSYVEHPFAKRSKAELFIVETDNGLARIFSKLREKHRVDFSYYKPSTIIRRIERRITINQCRNLEDYIGFIDKNPHEINTLFQDLLIGVTSFFRDEAVYRFLQENLLVDIIRRAERRSENVELRVWVAGCSTGEEAYSLSIIINEIISQHNFNVQLKIFATDVDSQAIEKASVGLYPDSIAADLPPEFLARYFVIKGEHYQISREIRESVVFAQHDLIKDPPFTNIDIITCRNLLIYLQPVLQQKVFGLFNFSLNNNGLLVLGSSESLGEMEEFYEPIDTKLRIFASKGKQRQASSFNNFRKIRVDDNSSQEVKPQPYNEAQSFVRFAEEKFYNRFLESITKHGFLPLTLVTDENMIVSHVFGDSSQFLRYPAGKIIMELSKIVIPELSIPVTTGLQRCMKTGEAVILSNIKIKKDDAEVIKSDVSICPVNVRAGQEPRFAIFIKSVSSANENTNEDTAYNVGLDAEQRIQDLEQELQFNRESLQATVEELETSNEELQATNEELLASNEELQSTNEELQSVNEELYTVNAEYQSKITELTLLNSDIDNLFSTTHTAAIFLDQNGRIRRFTPNVSEIFPIIATDMGRSIYDLSFNLGENIDIHAVISTVIKTGSSEEHEFQTQKGEWYLLKASPYLINNKFNSGAILVFIHINDLKNVEKQLNNLTSHK